MCKLAACTIVESTTGNLLMNVLLRMWKHFAGYQLKHQQVIHSWHAFFIGYSKTLHYSAILSHNHWIQKSSRPVSRHIYIVQSYLIVHICSILYLVSCFLHTCTIHSGTESNVCPWILTVKYWLTNLLSWKERILKACPHLMCIGCASGRCVLECALEYVITCFQTSRAWPFHTC